MKTLAQVEPRTPISALPFTISAPGSYYLTTNLVATFNGITISTNDVTVDLMGFSITGGRNGFGVTVDGKPDAPCRNVVVRNGTIKNFTLGMSLINTQNGLFEYLAVSESGHTGISLNSYSYGAGDCSGNRFANCGVSGNGGSGIYLGGYVGKCDGNSISGCTFRKNEIGVRLDAASNGQCNQNEFRNCMIQDNTLQGFVVFGSSGGRCYGNVVEGCNVSGNGDLGIRLYQGGDSTVMGNRISLCTLYGNTGIGIKLQDASASLISGNLVSGTRGTPTYGIHVSGRSPNLIVQNTCFGHTQNFYFEAAATHGPIVTASGALSTTNGAAGLSPWANFSR